MNAPLYRDEDGKLRYPTRADYDALYYKALAADEAWHAALVSKFGKRAGTMRYTEAGVAGDLAPLAKAFADANNARDAFVRTWNPGRLA